MHAADGHMGYPQEGEEGEEDDSDVSGAEERITDVSELARMASRGEPSLHRASPVAAVRHVLISAQGFMVLPTRNIATGLHADLCSMLSAAPLVRLPAPSSERVLQTPALVEFCANSLQIQLLVKQCNPQTRPARCVDGRC